MNQGLIGNWSPGIGDASVGGWVTVVLYLIAAWMTWRVLRDVPAPHSRGERHEQWFWRLLLLGLVLLALNKQLDLQSAFTEAGRIAAEKGGWYQDRRQVQLAFIAGMAIMGLTVFASILYLTRRAPASTWWTLLGATGLVGFVVIRAASFHQVDEAIGHQVAGLPINWLLEMGALVVIMVGAWRRRGQV